MRAARGWRRGWRGPVVVAGNVDARDEVGAVLGDVPARVRRQRGPADRRAGARRRRGRRSARCSCPTSSAASTWQRARQGRTSPRWSAAPRRTSCSPASSCCLADGAGRRRRGRRRRRRHHRRALGGRGRPRAGRERLAREVVAPDPGHPHRRGRPRHALVGGLHRRGGRAARPRGGRPDAGATTPASCPPPTRSTTRTRPSPAPRSASRCGGTPAAPGRGQPRGPGVERTGVDLREVGLVVGSGGVLRHGRAGVAERVLGPQRRTGR